MSYRILVARNGYYYVQKRGGWNGWSKVGGFFSTRVGARRFIDDHRGSTQIVEYR